MDQFNFFQEFNLSFRELRKADCSKIQGLLEQCSSYYNLISGAPVGLNGGERIFKILPKNISRESKWLVGFFRKDDRLVGIIDIIRNYPTPKIWLIGLLILDPEVRNQNIGSQILYFLETKAIHEKIEKIHLGVIQENKNAYRFWKRKGYKKIGSIRQQYGKNKKLVILMEKTITEE